MAREVLSQAPRDEDVLPQLLGAFLIGMIVLLLGGRPISLYKKVVPLMDPLKSILLVIHVFVASLATALFAIACGKSTTPLLQKRRTRQLAPAPAAGVREPQVPWGMIRVAGRTLLEVEREAIRVSLELAGGRQAEAARQLGLPKQTFHDRLRRLGLDGRGEVDLPRVEARG